MTTPTPTRDGTSRSLSARGRSWPQIEPDRPGPKQSGEDLRPLAGYRVLVGVYGALVASLGWRLRRSGTPKPLSALELLSFSLATQHLSRLVTKDSVTAVLRAPCPPAKEGLTRPPSAREFARPLVSFSRARSAQRSGSPLGSSPAGLSCRASPQPRSRLPPWRGPATTSKWLTVS